MSEENGKKRKRRTTIKRQKNKDNTKENVERKLKENGNKTKIRLETKESKDRKLKYKQKRNA